MRDGEDDKEDENDKEAIIEEGKALIKGYTVSDSDTSRSINIIFKDKNSGKDIFTIVEGDHIRQGQNQEGKFKVIATFGEQQITNVFKKHINNDNTAGKDGLGKIDYILGSISSAFRIDADGKLSEEKHNKPWNSWMPENGFNEEIKGKDINNVSVEFEYKGETIKVELPKLEK